MFSCRAEGSTLKRLILGQLMIIYVEKSERRKQRTPPQGRSVPGSPLCHPGGTVQMFTDGVFISVVFPFPAGAGPSLPNPCYLMEEWLKILKFLKTGKPKQRLVCHQWGQQALKSGRQPPGSEWCYLGTGPSRGHHVANSGGRCGRLSRSTGLPDTWPKMFLHVASAARSGSPGRSGCLTNRWIFLHTLCQMAHSVTQNTCLLQHTGLRKKNKVLPSVFFHCKFSFFCILLHFNTFWSVQQDREGSKRKEVEISPADWTPLLLSQFLDAKSGSNPSQCGTWAPGRSVKTWKVVIPDSPQSRSALFWDPESTLARGGRKHYKVTERINKRYSHKSWNVCLFYWDVPGVLRDSRCLGFANYFEDFCLSLAIWKHPSL